jgi:hypothetical protein
MTLYVGSLLRLPHSNSGAALVALQNKTFLEIERARGLNLLPWKESLRPALFKS